MRDEYYLFTFESTHGAISTEKLLKPLGVLVMPVPRAISTSCGIAVRVEANRISDAVDIFKKRSDLTSGEYLVYRIIQDKDDDLFEYGPYAL